MDPATIAIIITTSLTFLLNIYQSVKSRHFELSCSKCLKVEYDSEHQDTTHATPGAPEVGEESSGE